MRFLRHLSVVVLVVAVIVGLGMLWAHASGGAGTGIGGHPRQAPPPGAIVRLKHVKAGTVIGIRPASGFRLSPLDLADAGDLVKTCVIEGTLATAVISVSAVRRRRRRMRRAA